MALEVSASQFASESRRFFRDRSDPSCPFKVQREKRQGYVPEWTPIHKGQVYVASCDGLKKGVFKIGKSTDHFSKRSQALSQPTGVPGKYFPVYRLESDHFDQLEKDIFHILQGYRLHRRKEFVECSLEEIVNALRRCHRQSAPLHTFTEHFYFPIEEFELALATLYRSFLLQPGPKRWPEMCLLLSLLSGLPSHEILIRIAQGKGIQVALTSIFETNDTLWLQQYLCALMKQGYLPFGYELSRALPEEEKDLEAEIEKYLWYFDCLEELLWDAVYSCDFLRKVHGSLDASTTAYFCQMIHQKARRYLGMSPNDQPYFLSGTQHKLDFHFI